MTLDDLLDEGGAALLGVVDRLPDGTLIRRDLPWESAAALRARAGIVEHDEELVAVVGEADVWCPRCGYSFELHEDGCPSEAEAREAFGR